MSDDMNTNLRRAQAAIEAGSPDFGMNDPQTDLVDVLTNLLHWADDRSVDFAHALVLAEGHHENELTTNDEQSIPSGFYSSDGSEIA
jgi:hypothetical protein